MFSYRLAVAAVAAALLAVAGAASASDTPPAAPPADWGRALAEDARAFHDLIAESHPGPVDRENPGFNALLESGLKTALKRARTADSYEDWFFALKAYAASFDDGHLTLDDFQPMGHSWRPEWPGFLTGLRDGSTTVVFSRDPAAPPVGARLIQCDGRRAEPLAAELIGSGAGRWSQQSRRASLAGQLFIDIGNPYVRRPSQCVFELAGKRTRYKLVWRELTPQLNQEGSAAAQSQRFATPIQLRSLGGGGGGVWIGLSSFEGEVASKAGKELTALQSAVEARAPEIRAARFVVFDLRGNNGGSSTWIYGLARTLWGEGWVAARQPSGTTVEWRPSQANIDLMVAYKGMLGDDPKIRRWLDMIEAGLRDARAKGQPLWLQTDDEPPAQAPTVAPTTDMAARVYVLTDFGCASACLDAVDLLKALGGVQVGQETSGDTVYMEVRYGPLPSGRVSAGVPMKVYRGRARGNNETAVPMHEWTGALNDTAGIEAWIATIDARR
jgi:hypothetical protein